VEAAALNPAATGEVLRLCRLSESPAEPVPARAVPSAVPALVRTPAEVVADQDSRPSELAALAYTKVEKLRHQVAGHPHTPVDILTGYTRLDHWTFLAVIDNPSLPEDVIIDRFTHDTQDTRALLHRAAGRSPMSAAFARFLLNRWAVESGFRMVQLVPTRLAGNPAVPTTVLTELSKSDDNDTLLAVARNPTASKSARQRAAVRAAGSAASLAS